MESTGTWDAYAVCKNGGFRTDTLPLPGRGAEETRWTGGRATWVVSVLGKSPSLPDPFQVDSAYKTTAREAETNQALRDRARDFREAAAWFVVGIRVAAGLRSNGQVEHPKALAAAK